MSKSGESRTGVEKILRFSQNLDKIGIVGGLAIGLVNPVLGGTIAGGSMVTYEIGNNIERRIKNRSKKVGKEAVRRAA